MLSNNITVTQSNNIAKVIYYISTKVRNLSYITTQQKVY